MCDGDLHTEIGNSNAWLCYTGVGLLGCVLAIIDNGKLNRHMSEISTSSAEYESRSLEKARNDDDNSFVLLVKIVNLKLLSTSQCSSCAYASWTGGFEFWNGNMYWKDIWK